MEPMGLNFVAKEWLRSERAWMDHGNLDLRRMAEAHVRLIQFNIENIRKRKGDLAELAGLILNPTPKESGFIMKAYWNSTHPHLVPRFDKWLERYPLSQKTKETLERRVRKEKPRMATDVAIKKTYLDNRKNDYIRYLRTLCYGNVTAALIVKLVGALPDNLNGFVFSNDFMQRANPVLHGDFEATWSQQLVLPENLRVTFPNSLKEDPIDVEVIEAGPKRDKGRYDAKIVQDGDSPFDTKQLAWNLEWRRRDLEKACGAKKKQLQKKTRDFALAQRMFNVHTCRKAFLTKIKGSDAMNKFLSLEEQTYAAIVDFADSQRTLDDVEVFAAKCESNQGGEQSLDNSVDTLPPLPSLTSSLGNDGSSFYDDMPTVDAESTFEETGESRIDAEIADAETTLTDVDNSRIPDEWDLSCLDNVEIDKGLNTPSPPRTLPETGDCVYSSQDIITSVLSQLEEGPNQNTRKRTWEEMDGHDDQPE